jgi:hypothetical protein
MFCACMMGGTRYGTGYHFTNLTASNRVTAMEVRILSSNTSPEMRITYHVLVLVVLRDCILLRLHFLQDFHLHFLITNHRETNSYLDPLHCHGSDRPCRPGLHVPDASAMQAALVFLVASGRGPFHRGPLY